MWGGYDSNAIDKNLVINDAFVTEGEELLKGVLVELMIGHNTIDSAITDKTGGFGFVLKFDYKYRLRFSKEKYVTKLVEIDLQNMPPEAKKEGYDLGRFQLGMIRKLEGVDQSEYEVPVARYYYDERSTLIALDRVFLKKRRESIERQKEANNEIIADLNEEEKELQEEYNRLIRDGDIEFDAKDYEIAKEYYQAAIKLKPLEQYPRDQLDKIDDLEKAMLNEQQRYDALISQGDVAMEAKDYIGAETAYKSAIKIRTTESYPREQLKKIEEARKVPVKKVEAKKKSDYNLSGIQIGADKSAFCAALAKKYPQGLTEEISKEGGKTITRRIIVEGSMGVEYKKITHNWGGTYYFKNGSPTTNFVWQKEAMQE